MIATMSKNGPEGVDRRRRLIDLALASPGLLLVSPLIAATALAVRRQMGSPVLFRQERAGREGRPFVLLKFRTMTSVADDAFDFDHDAERITALGRRLRATSLDELPQLWNVLRGDMALVGPRPLPMAYVGRYTPAQLRRLDVRPGITGLAQVSGRNALTWEEKFALDAKYVESRTVIRDLRILWRTIFRVVRPSGVSALGYATMPEFFGDQAGTP